MFGKKKVKIDAALHARAREAASDAGYSSTAELVEHALERRLEELERRGKADRRSVEERLRGLGYIS